VVVLLPSDEQNALKNAATATADMLAALRLAVSGTDVASTNWGQGEHSYTRAQVAEISAARGVPDVAGAGQWIIPFTFAGGGKTWNLAFGGVSDSAPLWGGVMALADQYAHHDLGFVNPAIYRIARSTSYHQAFHDITTGNNTVHAGSVTITGYQAAPGWDPVTGWGSPDAQVLVPLLARLTSPSKT
jgi:subtilase family serine protease